MTENFRWLLLRYDVESTDAEAMNGYLARLATVHRTADLPVTLFCTGGALDARESSFRAFRENIADDSRFEIGDHSYTHIGIGYEQGQSVEILRADYERSLAAHERVLGRRPDSVTICGTGGKDGSRLPGFDATPKAQEELAMLVALGIRRINSFLTGVDESREFTDYARIGLPDIKGFPSGFSDTNWLVHAGTDGDFLAPLRAEIKRRAEENVPLPIVLHDWVTWTRAPDQEFTHVLRLAEHARAHGFVPMTIGAAVNRYAAIQTG
jgi:peptidoglycan/xylan/chitin deacetylase (PgdA/CDA1 family)